MYKNQDIKIVNYIAYCLMLEGLLRFLGLIMFTQDIWWWQPNYTFLFGSAPINTTLIIYNFVVASMMVASGYGLLAKKHWARIGAILASIFMITDLPVGTVTAIVFIVILVSPSLSKVYGKFVENKIPFRVAGTILTLVGVLSILYVSGVSSEITSTFDYQFNGFPTSTLNPQEKIQISSSAMSSDSVDVVIFLTAPIGTQSVKQQDIMINNIETLGGKITGRTTLCSNTIHATMSPEAIQRLAESGYVYKVVENKIIAKIDYSNPKDVECLNDVDDMVNARELWDKGLDGDNVVVAVMDTGINKDIPQLQRNNESVVIGEYTIYGEYIHWHGTAVASCIASQDPTYQGVAPHAKILNIEVFQIGSDGEPGATLSDILWGFDRIAEWKQAHQNYFVISSNSWGCPVSLCYDGGWSRPSELSVAANNLATKYGIPVVAAMGNLNIYTGLEISAPAVGKYVLGVGATDKDKNYAPFSCVGPTPDGHRKPDVSAPGVDINTFDTSGNLITVDGTSFATPITSGIMACIAEEKRDYTPEDFYLAFRYSADDIDKSGFDYRTGYGFVDGVEAYEIIGTIKPQRDWMFMSVGLSILGLGVTFYPEWGEEVEEEVDKLWRKKKR